MKIKYYYLVNSSVTSIIKAPSSLQIFLCMTRSDSAVVPTLLRAENDAVLRGPRAGRPWSRVEQERIAACRAKGWHFQVAAGHTTGEAFFGYFLSRKKVPHMPKCMNTEARSSRACEAITGTANHATVGKTTPITGVR